LKRRLVRRGFSLLEVILALAIVAASMAALGQSGSESAGKDDG
jgi:prepilin-type N-terminal cleavage/methylation domain-containing protein